MTADPSRNGGPDGVVSGSADAAIEAAEQRARETALRNLPSLPDLPLPDDTANLRLGENLNDSLLALLPLVGVWRGEGEAHHPDTGDYRFGQQIVVAHDGENYLTWEARSWLLNADGSYVRPDEREAGFWRFIENPTGDESQAVELLLTHSSGVVELFYGAPLNQSSWELATDVVIRSHTGAQLAGAKRLYGIVEGGALAYVEERIGAEGALEPRLSARLTRYIG